MFTDAKILLLFTLLLRAGSHTFDDSRPELLELKTIRHTSSSPPSELGNDL